MTRSEKAEQTYQQILAVSAKLFREQGYEKTSIQDILNELRLSKGAVYHHFKSKKEILDAILDVSGEQRLDLLRKLIKETQAKNAREKLAKVFSNYLDAADLTQLDKELMLVHMKDPYIFLAEVQDQMNNAKMLVDLLEEGISDGSFEIEYPLELAEIIFMMANIWLNPVLFNRNFEQTERRLKFLQQALSRLGVDVVSDEIIDKMLSQYQSLGYFE